MRISKNKAVATAVIAVILVLAYFSSGGPVNRGTAPIATASTQHVAEVVETNTGAVKTDAVITTALKSDVLPTESSASANETEKEDAEAPALENVLEDAVEENKAENSTANNEKAPKAKDENPTPQQTIQEEVQSKATSETPIDAVPTETPDEKDEYLSEAIPNGNPMPVEPQEAIVSDKEMTCFLSVSCHTILQNMETLNPEKVELVPESGIIFSRTEVVFYEGESVFNVLQREMKKNKIHMEFVNTPIYNSAYIEGINNLYEFDCGNLSGWMYKVNSWFPNYGCSRYQLRPGDEIEWVYTCDLGRDVGDLYFSAGSQKQ